MNIIDISDILEKNSIEITDLLDAMIVDETDIHELIYIMSNCGKTNKSIALHDSIYACRLFSLETVMKCETYDDIIWLIDNAKYANTRIYSGFLTQLIEALSNLNSQYFEFRHPAVKSNFVLKTYITKSVKDISDVRYYLSHDKIIKGYDLQIIKKLLAGYSLIEIFNMISAENLYSYIASPQFFSESMFFPQIYQENIFSNLSEEKQYVLYSSLNHLYYPYETSDTFIQLANFFEQTMFSETVSLKNKQFCVSYLTKNVLLYASYIGESAISRCKNAIHYIPIINKHFNESESYTEFMLNMTCSGIPLNMKTAMFYIFKQPNYKKMKRALTEWFKTNENLEM